MPARNGITAATMVARGFSGVEDVFSGERNFFIAHGRPADPEALVRGLGEVYEILRTNIKRWSVGSPIQAPLDSLSILIKEHGVKADDVEKLTVRVAHRDKNTTDNRDMPDICMQHLCAVMLLDGTVTFKSSHDEARFRHPKVLAVRKRIELLGDDALTKTMPARQGIVEIALRDGAFGATRGRARDARESDDARKSRPRAMADGARDRQGRAGRLCDMVLGLV
jgi:2-methylcitrate dehydratase PrpD